MEETKSVRQAFGSPGGKSYLAPRIVGMIPPHETYVEPFAGGAAVYFKKPPSEREVLSDKDTEIAFAFRFLRDMTPEQYRRLKRYDWIVGRETFDRLKASVPRDDVERFRRFYYTKKGSFKSGGQNVSPLSVGRVIAIDHLWKVHKRVKKTAIHGGDAIGIIRKYDSPTTFHYLDPPYPGRAFAGTKDKYTTEDLARLVNVLKDVKGKFALSLGTEHAKLLPKGWYIKRVFVKRKLVPSQTGKPTDSQYEIIATNYNPDTVIKRRISDRALHRERRRVIIYHKPGRRGIRGRRTRRSRVVTSVSLSRAR